MSDAQQILIDRAANIFFTEELFEEVNFFPFVDGGAFKVKVGKTIIVNLEIKQGKFCLEFAEGVYLVSQSAWLTLGFFMQDSDLSSDLS